MKRTLNTLLTAGALAGLGLTGCTTTNYYNPQNIEVSKKLEEELYKNSNIYIANVKNNDQLITFEEAKRIRESYNGLNMTGKNITIVSANSEGARDNLYLNLNGRWGPENTSALRKLEERIDTGKNTYILEYSNSKGDTRTLAVIIGDPSELKTNISRSNGMKDSHKYDSVITEYKLTNNKEHQLVTRDSENIEPWESGKNVLASGLGGGVPAFVFSSVIETGKGVSKYVFESKNKDRITVSEIRGIESKNENVMRTINPLNGKVIRLSNKTTTAYIPIGSDKIASLNEGSAKVTDEVKGENLVTKGICEAGVYALAGMLADQVSHKKTTSSNGSSSNGTDPGVNSGDSGGLGGK